MNAETVALWLALIGTLCWGVCFWWMHRISSKQNDLLAQLHEQGRRIEHLAKAEHDLIKQVHPQVTKIKKDVAEVRDAVDKK
jgi:predicted transcriptional regulator